MGGVRTSSFWNWASTSGGRSERFWRWEWGQMAELFLKMLVVRELRQLEKISRQKKKTREGEGLQRRQQWRGVTTAGASVIGQGAIASKPCLRRKKRGRWDRRAAAEPADEPAEPAVPETATQRLSRPADPGNAFAVSSCKQRPSGNDSLGPGSGRGS